GFALKQALAARFGVGLDQIVLGNGSNDILELATQAFLRPGDDTVYAQHAFAVYPLATQARGARGIEVRARDLGHDLAAMRAALADEDYVAESARLNRDGLAQLMAGLDSIGVTYLPSHGNFLMVRVADGGKGAAPIYEALLRSGVIVRPVANYGLPDWLRVTVGLPEENARFLSALGAALGK